jgi:hypothetical protein
VAIGDGMNSSTLVPTTLSGEWRGSEGRRASRPIESPPRSSSAEALPQSFGVRHDFLALVCSSVEALSESYSLCSSPSGVSGFPQHYLGVDDLPIIVSYPITSLMLFVHLHIVW